MRRNHFPPTTARIGQVSSSIGYSRYSYYLISLCSCFFPRLHPRLGGGSRAKEAKASKSKAPKKDQKEKEETKKPKVSATQIFGVFHVNVRKH